MAGKRMSRCLVVVLTVAFVASAFVVLISPAVGAVLWTQTTDTDFNSANFLNGVDVIGTGTLAYLQLKKDIYDWFLKNPLSPPPARLGHVGVFDTLNGRTLIFGGIDQSGVYCNDTWAYYSGNNTWVQVQASAPPSARWGAGMAFDTTNNVAVLYGGWDNYGQNFETWEYDAVSGAWTNTTKPFKPVQLTSNPLTFDSTANRVILAAQGKSTWETWAYDVTMDTWTKRTGSNPPQNRAGHMLAYYPELSRTVMYGGAYFFIVWDETWEYDYSADQWYNQTGSTGGQSPGGLTSFGFAYRNAYADIMLWGGQSSSGPSTKTWKYWYDAGQRYWVDISPSGSPFARTDFSMTYDRGTTSTVVFGGKDSIGMKLDDTWALEAGWRTYGFIWSSVFDSGFASTLWHYITWNQTPGVVPAGGQILFQIATNNVADPNDPSWSFVGPDGTSSTNYTNPGDAIWAGASPKRYIMYKGILYCTGCSDSPHLEDVSIDYTSLPGPPYVVSKGPETPFYFNVPVASSIWVNFSEPMDKNQVTVELNPPDVTLVYNWYDSDNRLLLTHPAGDLNYCTQYRPRITQAVDMEGESMASLPYEWLFVTICPDPYITATYPPYGVQDVPLSAPIWVNFSKPMNQSDVQVNATPELVSPTYAWSNGSKTLKVDHAGYVDCQWYDVLVNGTDVNHKTLIPGSVPNPWQFETRCLNPRVLSTDPTDTETEVPVTKPVVITFSHQMDTATVNAAFTPLIALSESWNSPLDTVLTLNHPPNFLACTVYTVNVTGKDTSGNDLQGGYYAFWFFTTCGGAPYIILTQPVHAAKDVDLNQNISITFSESMVPGSLVYTIEPSDWMWIDNWTMMNMNVNFEHVTPFSTCTRYYVNVTDGTDVAGNHLVAGLVPNRFYFDTVCTNPSVINIVPPDGAIDVLNDTNIAITFNKQMNEMTFVYSLKPLIGLIESWSGGSTVFHLDHPPLFRDCQRYDLTIVFAEDRGGNLLVGDRDFNFTTFCPGVNPWITATDPYNTESNVELTRVINVSFSEPMNPMSLSWLIVPDTPLGPQWGPDFTWVQLTHTPFSEATLYNITIDACDMDGDCLVPGPVPNPWEFTTLSTNPYITSTDPYSGEQDVATGRPIRVQFIKAMDPLTVNWDVVPTGIVFTDAWTNGFKTLTLSHAIPFNICTVYTVDITGRDTFGNPLVPGPVPNPWSFTTTSCIPGKPGGLRVSRQGNDILLTWRAPVMASGYHVYETGNRFTAWSSWTLLDNITVTSYTALNHNNDGLTHFYIVRAYNDTSWLEGGNSTMGVKLHKQFSYSPLGGNNQWFSLPYNAFYKKASDIATELGPSKVTVIAKWDPARQQSILYYYLRGKWRGPDFPINVGDGLWVSVVSSFSWSINGTDSARQLQFTLNSPPKTNYFWISLPYTNSYVDAAAISTELTSGLITEVGRYNPATGGIERWYWNGTIWTGVNFAIMPGEGIYLVIKATFNWTPKLITPEEP